MVFTLLSCKDDKDEVPPSISISSPIENTLVEMPDTLIVSARVEDDKKLEFINFGVVNENLTSVGERVSVGSISNPEEFSLSLEVSDLDIESGVHFLEVFASDGENDSREFVELNVIAIPKIYEGCAYIDELPGGNSVFFLTTDGELFSFASSNSGNLHFSVDGRLDAISVFDAGQNNLIRYSLESSLELWSVSEVIDSNDDVVAMFNDPFSRSTRLLTDEPSVISYNKEGLNVGDIDLDSEWSPFLLLSEESSYWIVSETPSGYRVSEIFKSSGFETEFFIIPDRPQQIDRLNEQELILITEQGDIRILNTFQGGQFEVPVAVSEEILDIQVIGGEAYFNSATQLFRYVPSSFQAPAIYSGSGISSLTYDEIGQRLILAEDGVLKFFFLNPLQNIGNISAGSSLTQIEAVFNK